MLAGSDFYVRRNDWRVVRRVTTRVYKDTRGLFGPHTGELRLPQFPLNLGGRADTVFKLRQRNDSSVLVREIPGVAETVLKTACSKMAIPPADVSFARPCLPPKLPAHTSDNCRASSRPGCGGGGSRYNDRA